MSLTLSMKKNSRIVSFNFPLLILLFPDFTNPIKRKEFDRQRKKQQMREMQNVSFYLCLFTKLLFQITGFTLGNFGIKSAKAMKEALPPYPENDETNVNNE